MGSKAFKLSAPFFLLLALIFLIAFPCSNAVSSCDGPCRTQDDCQGQLICISGKCYDDPDVVNNICGGRGGGKNELPPSGSCRPSGHLYCDGESYPKYYCSPPVTSSTQASLTLNDFSEGGDGGSKSECDNDWHEKSERVVALSTGWYDGGSRCGKMIRITALHNGRSVEAMVVDECDSSAGCDHEHAGQPPCRNNIVDGSDAVWEALGLDKDIGVVPITWSMA